MTRLLHPTDKYLFKVKIRNTILICLLWSKPTIKTLESCHAVCKHIEHIQQFTLFFIANFEQVFISWVQEKIHKHLKSTDNSNSQRIYYYA